MGAIYGGVMGLLIGACLTGPVFEIAFGITFRMICFLLLLAIQSAASFGFGAGAGIASVIKQKQKEEKEEKKTDKKTDEEVVEEVELPLMARLFQQKIFQYVYFACCGILFGVLAGNVINAMKV